jgi:hypothetical protein
MTSTAINITFNQSNQKCTQKCVYNISSYSDIHSAAGTNMTSAIMLNVASQNMTCSYEGITYTLANIMLCVPGIIYINGSTPPGCLLLMHVSQGQYLFVVIPISQNSSETEFLTELSTSMMSYAPNPNESTTINFNNFNLKEVIPKKPFATYAENNFNFLVFGYNQLSLSQTTLQSLQNYIQAQPVATTTDPSFIYSVNFKGPTISSSSNGSGEIYIDCSPTDESEETTYVPQNKNPTTKSFASFINYLRDKQIGYGAVCIIVFCFIIYWLSKGIKMIRV